MNAWSIITGLILTQTKTEKTKQTMQRWAIYGNLPTRDSSIMLLKSQTEKKKKLLVWKCALKQANGKRSLLYSQRRMEPGALLLLRWLPWVAEAIDYPDTSSWRALGKDDCGIASQEAARLNVTPLSTTWVRLQAQDQWHKQLLFSLRLELHFILVRLNVILSKSSQVLLAFSQTHTPY